MNRFILSLLFGLLVGVGFGLYLGWGPFPVEYLNSAAPALSDRHKEEYTVMVAAGYLADGDATGAVERLRVLGVDNVPAYVQEVTERYITNSRDVDDIQQLVGLAEGLGRLTTIMEPYRRVSMGGGGN